MKVKKKLTKVTKKVAKPLSVLTVAVVLTTETQEFAEGHRVKPHVHQEEQAQLERGVGNQAVHSAATAKAQIQIINTPEVSSRQSGPHRITFGTGEV